MKKILFVLKFAVCILFFSAQLASADLSTRKQMPPFLGITEWINGSPLTLQDLKGKVVLVYFWNYSNLECVRLIPHLNQWQEKYHEEGLAVVGIHTPEFAFEKEGKNIRKAVANLKITYPVAVDSDFLLSKLYENLSRPTQYLMDGEGHIRYVFQGEDPYEDQEFMIQDLLKEQGRAVNIALEKVDPSEESAALQLPSIYLGYKYLAPLGNEEKITAQATRNFRAPEILRSHLFYLSGSWNSQAEYLELAGTPGSLLFRSHANAVFMVLGARDSKPVAVAITLDGKSIPKEKAGKDITFKGEKSFLMVQDYKLYAVLDLKGSEQEYVMEAKPEATGVQAFEISFG